MEKELKSIISGAYRKAEEIRGEADAEATRIHGDAYGHDPAFYPFFQDPGDLQKGRLQECLCYSGHRLRLLPVPEDHPAMSKDNPDMRKESL